MKFLIMCLLSLPVFAAPVSNGVSVEKHTTESISVVLGTKDALSVNVCKDSGLVLNFDDFIDVYSDNRTIMRIIVTDNDQFDYKEFASSKGLFLKYTPNKNVKEAKTTMFITYNSGKDVLVNVTGSECKAKNLKPALIVNVTASTPVATLTPDQVIPAQLLTEILVSDKGSSQRVKVKVLADVHDKLHNILVIPKNTIIYGRTGSFDADTGTMNIELDTVQLQGRSLNIKFNVSSSDLTTGLKGQIRDTRGLILGGAYQLGFTENALSAMVKNNGIPTEAIKTEATGTESENVKMRIAQMYAGDLQNAAKIFYVPTNVPVIITPSAVN